jgi:hypothetical protein
MGIMFLVFFGGVVCGVLSLMGAAWYFVPKA